MKEKILNILNTLEIKYTNYEHQPAFTCNDAKWIDIPWIRVKSLFLRNRNYTRYYMVVLEDNKRFDSSLFRKLVWENKITFANKEKMIEKIWVKPGHVSPLALINNKGKDVKVVFNSTLKDCEIGFHPWQNDNTTVLDMVWVEKYLNYLDIKFEYLNL